ncbi:hypothetical protein M3210_08320 [Oceanobacillus luteolus]|uniref:YkoP-like domain-containing protein n=1 Tax=Oceanobacillus luteolus TaxID=1274358 RepID=A0ABW4HR42_9BACI|nr:hypothetical protein [Oceanobacillus luteolus]
MWTILKKNSLLLWDLMDPIYFRITRLDYVPDDFGERTIMRVRLTKYKGRSITLSDGTVIHKNDCLLKIHLHNIKILKQIQNYDSDVRKAYIIYKSVQDSLPAIAHYIQGKQYSDKIKGLIGISVLNKGAKLGFESFTIQNRFYKLFKQVAFFSIHLLSSKKCSITVPEPKYLFMSKEVLLNRYLGNL